MISKFTKGEFKKKENRLIKALLNPKFNNLKSYQYNSTKIRMIESS